MSTEFKTKYKRSLLDSDSIELHLHPNFIEHVNKNMNNSITTFKLSDIKEFRYGVRWYHYYFIFGREYQIYVRNYNNEVIKINFSTYFKRKKKIYSQLYSELIDSLWKLYFYPQVDAYLKEFEAGEIFQIGETNINPEGIIIRVSELTKLDRQLIPWKDVRTRDYATYFSIYSAQNPRAIHRGYSYKEDWNTAVLYSVVRTILRDNKIEEH